MHPVLLRQTAIAVGPRVVPRQSLTDNSAILLVMVQHGAGIARLLNFVARPWVQTGELVPLLRGCFECKHCSRTLDSEVFPEKYGSISYIK